MKTKQGNGRIELVDEDEKQPDPSQQPSIDEIRRQNAARAVAEVNAILERYNCQLVPYRIEGPSGVKWATQVESK